MMKLAASSPTTATVQSQGLPPRKLTASLPLNIDPWKRRFLLETTICRAELLVLGGVAVIKLSSVFGKYEGSSSKGLAEGLQMWLITLYNSMQF